MELTVSLGKLGFLLASNNMWEVAGGAPVCAAMYVLLSQYLKSSSPTPDVVVISE